MAEDIAGKHDHETVSREDEILYNPTISSSVSPWQLHGDGSGHISRTKYLSEHPTLLIHQKFLQKVLL